MSKAAQHHLERIGYRLRDRFLVLEKALAREEDPALDRELERLWIRLEHVIEDARRDGERKAVRKPWLWGR